VLGRINPRGVIELARSDVPAPVDVINLISPSRFERYKWYGMLVLPALTAVRGRILWMGRFERSLAGEKQADKLLVVRYPSHRRFLAMTLNPYYLAINRLREAGVKRFEASFTHASHTDDGLSGRRELIGVHFNSPGGTDALEAVAKVLESAGCELVYATRATASLGFLDPPRDTDPNPLTYSELALFAPNGEFEMNGSAALLAAVTDGCSVQAYRREPRSAYRPSFS
jgi:uncharacterized protein (DUF1330 family)